MQTSWSAGCGRERVATVKEGFEAKSRSKHADVKEAKAEQAIVEGSVARFSVNRC
jgi:hypothetical protein